MEAIKFTGKSVQDAIKKGLLEMNLGIDEADIKIISEGSLGIFGIGSKKAVVSIKAIDDENILTDKDAGFAKDVVETPKQPTVQVPKQSKMEHVSKSDAQNIVSKPSHSKRDETPSDPHVTSKEHIEFLNDYLSGLFSRMNLDCNYSYQQKGETIFIDIKSEQSGRIIGHRGETLDAIQYLTRLAIHKTDLPYRAIVVQTENYREKREQTLRALSKRIGARVEATGKTMSLEPMKAFERRVIHETLQDNPKLTTSSAGTEPNRYVVISLVK